MSDSDRPLPTIQMLWINGHLSRLEKLSMASFLACGHQVNLYTYGLDAPPPEGVSTLDANEIISSSKLFRHQGGMGYGSWAPFSDLFRFTLLYELGGIWCDTDMVCLKPISFAFEKTIFFSSELAVHNSNGKTQYLAYPNCGAIQTPAKHPLIKACLEKFHLLDKGKAEWAASGPGIVRTVIEKSMSQQYVLHPEIFCSVPHWEAASLLFGNRSISPNAYAIHFWNEVLRWNFFNKDARYDPYSIYERLAAHYLNEKHSTHV